MLANNVDDREGRKEAAEYFRNDANQQELELRQKDGLLPLGPVTPDKKLKQFEISLPKGNKSVVAYGWVELGPQECKQLGLDNAAQFESGDQNEIWKEAKKNRGKAAQLQAGASGMPVLQGALFYSRQCLNRNMPEEVRRAKKTEYFVLARNPEIDLNDPQKRETPRISGEYIESAYVGSTNSKPVCRFRFNRFGAELLGNLTAKNLSTDADGSAQSTVVKRHLAIILDGLVKTAPYISTKISDRGQITGTFTQAEVKALVDIFNAGALPATLKPQPVMVKEVWPEKSE